MRFQNLERRNRENRFATDPQRVSAGGHDHESRARSQEFGGKIRNSRHQVLAIVEHQQDVLAAQKTQQSRAQRPVGFFPGAHRRGDGFHDAPGLCDQSQLDEPHAVPILVNQLRAAFKGQAGLSRAPRAHEGQQAGVLKQLLYALQLLFAPDKTGGLHG